MLKDIKSNSNKGAFFSFDTFLALTLMFAIIGLLGIYYSVTHELEYRQKHTEAEDIMSFLTSFSAGEMAELEDYINESDTEKTILELIGSFWASGDKDIAEDIARTSLENKTKRCWELEFSGEAIGIGCEEGETVSTASRLASGYEAEEAPEGFMARGSITDAESLIEDEYAFFGGYVGDGNITKNISLDNIDTIHDVNIEMDAGGNFSLFINDEFSGDYVVEEEGLRADKWKVEEEYWNNFEEGENNLRFNFTSGNSSISGGYFYVRYNLTEFFYEPQEKGKDKYRFPGIEGIINLYDALEVPGTLEGLDMGLKYDTDATLFLNLGGATIYETESNEEMVRVDNETIHERLEEEGVDYETLSNKTIPLRLGVKDLRELPGIYADPDVVATTDVSGNMDARLHDTEYHDKWEATEAATNLFLDVFDNATEARAGLTAFNNEIYSYHPLSNNTESLRDELEDWSTGGPTCVGCGILKSITSLLTRQSEPWVDFDVALERGSQWRYSSEHTDGWNEPGYDASEWEQTQAPLEPNELGESEEYYFRKSFDYFPIDYRQPFFSFFASGDLDIYLNGEHIYSSKNVGDGSYWDEVVGKWANISGLWHLSDNRNIVGNKSWYFGIEESYNFNTNKHETGNLSSPWMDLEGVDEKKLSFNHWLDIEDNQNNHVAYVEIDQGDGWEILEEYTGPTTGWEYVSIDVPETDTARIRFRFDSLGEVDSNYEGWYVDNVTFAGFTSDLADRDLFKEEGNVLAMRYEPETPESTADIEISAEDYRYRSMIVVSSGDSNQGTDMEEALYHDSLDSAVDHTIEAACRAHERHDIIVHTVAFVDEDDESAIEEMQEAAECGGGDFYLSDADDIEELYEKISHDILEATMHEQRVVAERKVEDKLYHDSHINISYSEGTEPLGYGEIPLTFESSDFGDEVSSPQKGHFWVGEAARPIEARVTSYSSRFWSSVLNISNENFDENIYNLSEFGDNYEKLGDPYPISIPAKYIEHGNNTVFIDTSNAPGNFTGGSPDSKVIYTVAVNASVGYGDVFQKYEGGNITVDLATNESYTMGIGNISDPWDPEKDALDNMVQRLLDRLDVNNDGKVDVRISEENLRLDEIEVGGVPFLWGPGIFTLKIW